jgi:hypothetical protein
MALFSLQAGVPPSRPLCSSIACSRHRVPSGLVPRISARWRSNRTRWRVPVFIYGPLCEKSKLCCNFNFMLVLHVNCNSTPGEWSFEALWAYPVKKNYEWYPTLSKLCMSGRGSNMVSMLDHTSPSFGELNCNNLKLSYFSKLFQPVLYIFHHILPPSNE